MIFPIVISTFFFVCISFLYGGQTAITNSFIAYFITEVSFLLSNLIVFTLGYIFFVLIFINKAKIPSNYSFSKKIRESSLYFLQIIILGFFLSYITLFIIAFFQLNLTSVLMRINPKILGINTNASNIANQIKTNKISPKMIINEEEGNEVASITQAITGDNNIYGKIILPSVPNFLIIPNKNTYSSFILIDDVLIISEINTKDLELISPIVSHLFVSDYFGNKYVKSYPVITVLNDNEFQKYRQKENEKKIIEIDKQLLNIKNYISTISAAIKNDNRQILINKSDLNDQQDENNLKYEKCLKYYDINYCKTIINNLNKNSDTNNSDLEEWRKQLEFDESLLKAYKYYDEFFKLQRANLENFKYIIHNEQGVFEPENNIKARVDSKEANSITTFFSVVIHEYFHYASYKKGKKFTNSFFEEGLTEYFSRQVIKHNLGVSTNLGYPIQSKIISQIAQKIAENELIGIYFSKDDNLFAQAMDRVYGDGFYEKNKITFEALQYATTPQELTKLANDIMVQIGGTKISEKDYYSSSN